jgi:hypothetical protein
MLAYHNLLLNTDGCSILALMKDEHVRLEYIVDYTSSHVSDQLPSTKYCCN